MGISKVLIIPGYGHKDVSGAQYRGESIGKFSQLDIIEKYQEALEDELESQRINFSVMNVGPTQKIHETLRYKLIDVNVLVLHLACGWFDTSDRTLNQSSVFYSTTGSGQFAEELSESLHDWGHCIVHGHRSANPKTVPGKQHKFLSIKNTVAVKIEPFALNGPNAEEYMKNLEGLGRDIGVSVANYAKIKEPSLFSIPPSHFQN